MEYVPNSLIKDALNRYDSIVKNIEALQELRVSSEIAELDAWASSIIDKVCAGREFYNPETVDAFIEYAKKKYDDWFKNDLRYDILSRDFSSAFERRTYIYSKLKQVTKEIQHLSLQRVYCKTSRPILHTI